LWWLFGKISVASGLMRISHVALATLAGALCAAACTPPTTGRSAVRVLVYNIHAGKDATRTGNLERVAEIIRESRADVILLQEVDNRTRRSGGVDQLTRLRILSRYNGIFAKAIDFDNGEYGIAVLSRWPITGSSVTALPVEIGDSPSRTSYEQRVALTARISAPWGTIRVIDSHLDATRADSYRVQQARTLLTIVNAQRDSGFTIFGGDLNSGPESPVAEMILRAGWQDMFPRCGTGDGFSFPADRPTKRIDYLFAGRDTECRAARVLNTQASDHRPVLFEVAARRD
jgi:endonuclease/exonuclease/phosphatase family metal-dependent hydrolase